MSPANDYYDIEAGLVESTSKAPSKSMKKKMSKAVKSVFKSKKKKGEQAPILQYDELKTAGTFDSNTTPDAPSTIHVVEDPFPRSPNRMAQKWSQIRNQMSLHDLNAANKVAHLLTVADEEEEQRRKTMMREEQKKIQAMMGFSLKQCLLAILLYVVVSVCCFSFWLEDWSVVDSVYFAVVTFTTIGYGDVVPDTRLSRLFTCFWALSGVACLGIALGVLGSQLVHVSEQDEKKNMKQHQDELFDMFDINNVPRHVKPGDASLVSAFSDDDEEEGAVEFAETQCYKCLNSPKTARFALLFAIMAVMLYLIAKEEQWTVWVTIYYGIITASTVGYGDLAPVSETGRILAVCYIPIAVGLMGSFLDLVASSIIERRRESARRQLKDKELTLKDLMIMDSDGDGTVTRAEFLEFMLVAMNQVDEQLLENLRDHFDQLDKDKSGTLDKDDLVRVAHYNLQKQKSRRR